MVFFKTKVLHNSAKLFQDIRKQDKNTREAGWNYEGSKQALKLHARINFYK